MCRKHVITEQGYIAQLVRCFEADGVRPVPIFINGIEAHTVVRFTSAAPVSAFSGTSPAQEASAVLTAKAASDVVSAHKSRGSHWRLILLTLNVIPH